MDKDSTKCFNLKLECLLVEKCFQKIYDFILVFK